MMTCLICGRSEAGDYVSRRVDTESNWYQEILKQVLNKLYFLFTFQTNNKRNVFLMTKNEVLNMFRLYIILHLFLNTFVQVLVLIIYMTIFFFASASVNARNINILF